MTDAALLGVIEPMDGGLLRCVENIYVGDVVILRTDNGVMRISRAAHEGELLAVAAANMGAGQRVRLVAERTYQIQRD